MNRITGALAIIAVLLVGCTNDKELINSPQKGDVYIFEEKGVFSPVQVDKVAGDTLYIVNSRFVFTDAIPQPSEILDEEFDRSLHLIYKKQEMVRLYDEGKIIEVYRK